MCVSCALCRGRLSCLPRAAAGNVHHLKSIPHVALAKIEAQKDLSAAHHTDVASKPSTHSTNMCRHAALSLIIAGAEDGEVLVLHS